MFLRVGRGLFWARAQGPHGSGYAGSAMWWLGCFLADLRAEIWLPSGVPIVMCVFSGREAAIKGTGNYKNTSW